MIRKLKRWADRHEFAGLYNFIVFRLPERWWR